MSGIAAEKHRPSALVTRIEATSRRPATMGAAVPEGVISLAMGEPSEGTPGSIVDAAVAALHAGRTRYEALTGSPVLRSAIASHLTEAYGHAVAPDQIVCTHGGSGGLAAAVLATIDPGDRVVIPEPTYSLYADHVALAGGEVVWVANRPDGSIDVDRVRVALTAHGCSCSAARATRRVS